MHRPGLRVCSDPSRGVPAERRKDRANRRRCGERVTAGNEGGGKRVGGVGHFGFSGGIHEDALNQ